MEAQDVPREYNVTNLTNGFTVLTESQAFPGAVHMGKWLLHFHNTIFLLNLIMADIFFEYVGFLMDVGTRDETGETSGSLLAMKNTYLKTLKHTNETINYGMI